MAVHKILVYGDRRLEAPNAPVERFDAELQDLVADMFETCYAAPGLGLAAPQIGRNLQLAVVDLSLGKDPEQAVVLANPELVHSEGRTSMEEGCLSFPGLFTTITRPKLVRVRAQDLTGETFEIEGTEILGQALCHELDHLAGILLPHHLRGVKKSLFLRKVKRMRDLGVWNS